MSGVYHTRELMGVFDGLRKEAALIGINFGTGSLKG